MDVALDGREHDRALAAGVVGAVDVRLEVRHRGLHDLGRLQHERQLHLAAAEELADGAHAGEQVVVDDVERALPGGQRLVEVGAQALGLAVDDAPLQPLPERQGGQLRGAVGARGGGVHTLEHVEEHLQGVVRDVPVGVAPAAVVDEVEGDLALVLGDPRHREDLGRVHDRRVEPRLDGLVQEHRVEHDPGGGVEAEGDVRDAERGLHLRVAALDLADRLDGRQPVAARLLLAGRDREGQAVDEDVVDPHAPAAGERLDQPDGDVDLVLDRAGLALLVDRQRHDGRAVLAHDRHDLLEPAAGPLAVLEVDAVDDRAAADELEARLDHGGLGGVEHQRQGRRGREPAHDLAHVGDAVAAHVVDADVEQVRAVAGLVAGDGDALVPAPGQHRLAEGLGAVGVRALADREVRRVLPERHVLVDARDARLGPRAPGPDAAAVHPLDDGTQVLGGRAAAPADQREAELAGEGVVRVGQLGGRERVVARRRG